MAGRLRSSLVPTPGWYADPHVPGQLRWWDGASWSAHTMPAPFVPPSGPYGGEVTQPSTSSRRTALVVGAVAVCGLLLVAVVLVVALTGRRDPTSQAQAQGHDSDLGTGGPADTTPLATRAAAADIPLLGAEGSATHTHTLLHVEVDGKKVTIPAGIGIDSSTNRIAAVHTHASTGVLHVESPDLGDTYRLAQFLTLWGVGSDEASICQHLAGGPCHLTVTVIDPTSADQRTFHDYGPMPEQATTAANGLDTQLDQGAVILVELTTGDQPDQPNVTSQT